MAQANIEIILGNGQKAGQTINELRQQANRLTKEINNLKPGTEEFVKKSADLNKVTGRLGEVRKEVNGTKEASNGLLQSFQQYIPFNGQLQKMSSLWRMGTTSVKGFRLALIATGLGAFVVILGSLVTWLTSTQEGMDKVTKVTRPLSALFQRLIGVVQELGGSAFKSLSNAVNDPIAAIKRLGDMIKDNLINRFESLSLFGPALAKIFKGDLVDGFTDLGNATLQLGTGIEDVIGKTVDAAKSTVNWVDESLAAGTRLDELQKRIERREIETIKRREQLKLISKQSNDIAEDENASLEAREAAARRAINSQVELQKIELELIDLKIEKMKLEHTLNDTSREDEKELAELEASRFAKQTEIQEARTTLRNKLNIIRKAEIAAEKKEQDELAKAAEERFKLELKARENLQNLNIELMEDGLQKEIEKMWLDTERKIEALVGTEEQITEQRILLEDLRLQKLQELRAKHAEKQLTDAEKTADKEKKIEEDKAKFKKDMADVEAGIASDVTGFLSDELSSRAKDEEAAKQIQKASQLTEIGINLQGELSANALAAAANPLNAVTFGAAGAAQLTRSNLASLLRAGLSTAKVVAFEQGGLLQGPRHLHGGIRAMIMSTGQPIEMEGGEYVFSRKAVQGIGAGVLDSINRRYETGGPVNPFSAPTSTKTASDFVSSSSGSDEALIREFRAFKEEITQWQRELIANNNLQEVDRGLKTLNKLENNASV